jgi:hypothetical protein
LIFFWSPGVHEWGVVSPSVPQCLKFPRARLKYWGCLFPGRTIIAPEMTDITDEWISAGFAHRHASRSSSAVLWSSASGK